MMTGSIRVVDLSVPVPAVLHFGTSHTGPASQGLQGEKRLTNAVLHRLAYRLFISSFGSQAQVGSDRWSMAHSPLIWEVCWLTFFNAPGASG